MNIGPGEILLLAIMALILFGPKRLPEIGRQVGRALAEVRKVSREFEREVKQATDPFEQEFRAAERGLLDSVDVDEDLSHYRLPPPEPGLPATADEAPHQE